MSVDIREFIGGERVEVRSKGLWYVGRVARPGHRTTTFLTVTFAYANGVQKTKKFRADGSTIRPFDWRTAAGGK